MSVGISLVSKTVRATRFCKIAESAEFQFYFKYSVNCLGITTFFYTMSLIFTGSKVIGQLDGKQFYGPVRGALSLFHELSSRQMIWRDSKCSSFHWKSKYEVKRNVDTNEVGHDGGACMAAN